MVSEEKKADRMNKEKEIEETGICGYGKMSSKCR